MKKSAWLVPTGLFLSAALLRFWNLPRLGLSHFDEGSYAMAGHWIASLGHHGAPPQAGQAPALFPLLLAISFVVLGVHDFAAIAVSVMSGTLTVLLVWKLGRSWFGEPTGLGAALLLATCEYHLMYSRMALTDATFVLFFWCALYFLYEGVSAQRLSYLRLGGFFTGLAWNTKYHGFLPLALVLLFCLLGSWFGSSDGSRRYSHPFSRLWPALAIAVTMMLPWVLAVALTTGWSGVLRGLWSHSLGQGVFPATLPSTLFFYLNSWTSAPFLVLALTGALAALIRKNPASLFLLTTVLSLTLLELLYMPFPRLLLPAVPGLALLASSGLTSVLSRWLRPPSSVRAALLLLSALAVWNLFDALPALTARTDAYRRSLALLRTRQEPILSQMSKNFYFYDEGQSVEMRWHDPSQLDELTHGRSWVVAVDPTLDKLPQLNNWLRRQGPLLTPLYEIEIGGFPVLRYQGINPSDDSPDSSEGQGQGGRIRIFELSPDGGSRGRTENR